ncbi:MAG: site-specific DNA-methyltransferase [Candidatus Thorarchaeota archaeon]
MSNEIHDKFKLKLLKILQPEIQDYNIGIAKVLNFKRSQIQNIINSINLLDLPEEMSKDIYNSLLKFFSQYYKKGELYHKRRHHENSKSSSNENEVHLYWVSKDQHYVKSIDLYNKSGKITSKDYFIHKNLNGFLKTEFDLFIRNEILKFDLIKKLDYEDLKENLTIATILEEITSRIIDLLAQIENFQLKLWKKRNFVLKTNYVITLDKIKEYAGESFLENQLFKIFNSKEQMKDWSNLFEFKDNNKSELTKNHKNGNIKWKHLPIDTKYFDEDFKWELITALTKNHNLDNILDGILIKSENFQALNLIMKKWREKINLIYIDPPFNTGNKEYPYKNDYSDSTWLAMMHNRLNQAREILNKNGSIFVRINNKGNHYLRFLLDIAFGKPNFRNEIIINKTRAKKQREKPFIQQTESLFFYSINDDYYFNQIQHKRKEPKWYELLDLPRSNENPRIVLGKKYYPPKGRRWGLSQQKINMFEQKGKVRINKKKKYVDCFGNVINERPELYYDLEPIRNDWLDISGYSQVHKFSTENSEELLQRVIECGSKENDIILDYFLGSGTTSATAQKINRRWIGIEMGDHFEGYVLPRMKSVLNGEKSGISKTVNVKSGGFFKYHYLEQFEDSVENVKLTNPKKLLFKFVDNRNQLILNIETIEDPFQFKIWFSEDHESKLANVDLIETFNYLLGLVVEKIKKTKNENKNYIIITGKAIDTQVAIVWRDVFKLDYEQDEKFIKENLKNYNYDILYVNGSCLVKDYSPIEVELKKLICEY